MEAAANFEKIVFIAGPPIQIDHCHRKADSFHAVTHKGVPL
jgi:hypothetical protein